jgi:hypothetical protein
MSGKVARLYEQDFVRWTEEQAAALRAAAGIATNLPLDWENLAEEIDGLGRSLKHELRSRLIVVLEHLLKLEYSQAIDPRRGWTGTVRRQRLIIEDLLKESPSLRVGVGLAIEQAKLGAVRLAAGSLSDFGEAVVIPVPGYTEEQVLGEWFPPAPASLHPSPLPASEERE